MKSVLLVKPDISRTRPEVLPVSLVLPGLSLRKKEVWSVQLVKQGPTRTSLDRRSVTCVPRDRLQRTRRHIATGKRSVRSPRLAVTQRQGAAGAAPGITAGGNATVYARTRITTDVTGARSGAGSAEKAKTSGTSARRIATVRQ